MRALPSLQGGQRTVQVCVGLLFALAYANSLGGAFQFDDFNVIVDYSAVHSLEGWLADVGQGIRPLLKLSYTLNWISGAGLLGFHVVNLLIHGATVCIVYRLTQDFLALTNLLQRVPMVPFLSAALFSLHPASTEAVTYISARSSSLMTLFYLSGLLIHSTQPIGPGAWRARLLVPWCFVMAMAVKESAVTFPLALLLWDLASGKDWRSCLRKGWTSWAVLLLAAAWFLWNDAYRASAERSASFNTLSGNLATQAQAVVYLFRQWALPLWLNIDPDLAVHHDFSQAMPGLVFVLAVCLGALLSWRKRPWVGFALGWALLHLLLLHLFLPRLDVANDRQLYLASWPLCMALMVELELLLPKRIWAWVVATLLTVFAMLTFLRNQDYQSEVTLWEQTVQVSPGKSRVHSNLGYAYQLSGRPVQARLEYLQALRLDAGNVKARLNLRRLNFQFPRT
jgi:tetratricopeptide (TPR) repeat protein